MGRISDMDIETGNRSFHTRESYPYAPSPGKTDTSAEAAKSFKSKHNKYWLMVKRVLTERGPSTNSEIFEAVAGLTDQQKAEYYRLRDLERSLQPRCSEGLQRGDLFEAGKRKNRNGRNEIVWTLTDPNAPLGYQGRLL